MRVYIGGPMCAKTARLIQGGILAPSVRHWHRFTQVVSCPLLCATRKTNNQVDLRNHRLPITLFSMHLSPSSPSSLSGELPLTWAGFAPLTWILLSFS